MVEPWPVNFNSKVWPDYYWPNIEASTAPAAIPEYRAYTKIVVASLWRPPWR